MFIGHEKYLAMLTPKKQEELNGKPFVEVRAERIQMVKTSVACNAKDWHCRGCTGVRPTCIDGLCDGILTKAEHDWVRAQIDLERAKKAGASRPAQRGA
ncbi:MAG: hypothetical protein LBL21_02060 [Rickettsiales bacterium]|jgi:hypothetical protein|nr:hypothetical protein [Rickettsiales bacterium]